MPATMGHANTILSSALMGIALIWLSFTTGDYLTSVFPGMVIMGVAVGLFAAPLTTVAMVAAGLAGMAWPAVSAMLFPGLVAFRDSCVWLLDWR